MNEITIENTNVTVKEYKGQRVVTFKDIDTVHQRPDGTARRNFNTNKKHFIEGEDYFKITPNEFRTAIAPMDNRQSNDVTLLTESGYLMVVKSFTDDLSWDVQRQLVKCYFKLKELTTPVVQQLPYAYIEKTYRARPVMTANDISGIFGVNQITLYSFIKTRLVADRDYSLLQGEMLKEYNKENSDLPNCRKAIFVVYNTGLSRIASYFDLNISKTPKFMTEQRGYVVDTGVNQLMEYIRRELKGVEALTYLIESDEIPRNLENYRKILIQKLSLINWWKSDVAGIKLGIHQIGGSELTAIHSNKVGMRY